MMIDYFRAVVARLLGFFRVRRADQEFDDEIETHMRLLAERYLRQGMSDAEAALAARRQFGNVTLLKEDHHGMRGIRLIDTLFQDLRYGARMMLKHKGFTIVAALTLALGIGANTAIFSVVNAVLLNPFAYPDADQIIYLSQYDLKHSMDTASVTYPNFLDWQKQQASFTHLAAARAQTFNLTGGDEPIFVNGAMISPDTFPLLKLPPLLGRVFTERDNQLDSSRTVVLSYAFWQSRFGGEKAAIGSTIRLDSQAYAIIGVMPPQFKFWGTEIWVPYGLFGNEEYATNRRVFSNTGAVGRLKPHVTITQARTDLSMIAARLAEQYPDSNKDLGGAKIIPLSESASSGIRPALLALMGAVGLVLLIACANVANLLIARDAGRGPELAIRAALGAGRARLLRQLQLECLPLAMLGSLAGLLLARSGLGLILKLLPEDLIPAESEIGVDAWALAFTLLLSLLTTLICSLLPALRFSRGAALEGLRNATRPGAGVSVSQRMRGALVILEVALSVVLLVGAGLLIKSFTRLQRVDLGFNPESLLTIDLSLSSDKYRQPQQLELFYREALERVKAIPGLGSAAFMNGAPFSNFGDAGPLIREGQVFNSLEELSGRACHILITHGDAISALGTPLILGRDFTAQDTSSSEPVAIINQAAADKFFSGEYPLGKRIKLGLPDNLIQPGMLPRGVEKFSWLTVVGIVKNHRQLILGNEFREAAFIPLAQAPRSNLFLNSSTLLVRSTKDPLSIVNAARRQLHSVDPDLPFAKISTMKARIYDSLKPQRFNTFLMGLFATLALLLAVVGLYGVLSYMVLQRRHEIGVRIALGAQTRDVLGLVVREGMTLTLIGIAIGLMAAIGLTRLIETLLFSVSATDPLTFLVIALLFAMVALLACYLPARRATKVDPMVALRSE
ncbi:MAG: ABC transporter permease [Chloracidobacterium sp.]|nr:ABC transporter permease [Chloracidobacterium sp.]